MTIAGYIATKGEVDVMHALVLLGAHHVIALPRMGEDSKVLSFRRFMPGDVLTVGAFGIQVPSQQAEEIIPDIIITPLVAFDRAGHRVGYGAGFYDATLGSFGQSHHVTAVGAAFALQEVDAVPAEAFDRRLDIVVTEKEIITIA